MDKLLDIIGQWDRFGQFVFFVFLILVIAGVLSGFARFVLVLLRGYPQRK